MTRAGLGISPSQGENRLEVFIHLLGHGDAFWFFDDFSRIARMNPKLTNRIIKEDPPISRTVQSKLISMAKDSGIGRQRSQSSSEDALEPVILSQWELTRLLSLIPLPPEDLWEKLARRETE